MDRKNAAVEVTEGAQPLPGSWRGLAPNVPTSNPSNGGSAIAGPSNANPTGNGTGPSNSNPTGNGSAPDGKDAAGKSGPTGQQGPQGGKPSGTNAASTGKDAGASRASSEAEVEFKKRFPGQFLITTYDDDDDAPKQITGLFAIVETMKAMKGEAEYKTLRVPTYDDLKTIRKSHSTVLEKFTGGEFGPDNFNADGINYILNIWPRRIN
ncbi:MAG: hypothetical protein Q9221_001033 [Calogaya cf. arnoldii]